MRLRRYNEVVFSEVVVHGRMFVEVNGIRMSYQDRGEGEPVVIIGGFGTNGAFWDPVVGMLDGYRVVTYDNRGVGDTEYEGPFTVEDLAEDAVALMDHLGIPKAHVVGWSMGSQVAQILASRHGDRVKSLTLISTYRTLPCRSDYILTEMNDLVLRGNAPIDVLAIAVNAFCFPEGLFRSLRDSGRRMEVPEKMEAAEGLADQLDAMRVCDTTDLLSEINVPTLVIHGGRDIMVEPSEGAAVAGAVPGSRLLILESAGHSIPPELYLGELRSFMDSNV